jgi:hypothetical protein
LQQVEQFHAEPVMPFLDYAFALLLLGSNESLQEVMLFRLRIMGFRKLPGVLDCHCNVLDESGEQLDITVVKILVAILIREKEKSALVMSVNPDDQQITLGEILRPERSQPSLNRVRS